MLEQKHYKCNIDCRSCFAHVASKAQLEIVSITTIECDNNTSRKTNRLAVQFVEAVS